MNSKLKGHAAMFVANVMWGLMAPVVKVVIGAGVILPLVMTDFRIFGAALLFWIASCFMPHEHVPARDKLTLFLASLFGIMFNQGCYVFGVGLTSPGEAAVVTTTMPLWVMILAALVLKEPVTLKKAGGIAVGAAGTVMLVLSGNSVAATGDNHVAGDVIVLLAQLSTAIYLTFYKNFIQKYSVITLMKWMFTFASLTLLPFSVMALARTDWGAMTMTEISGVAYVVLCGTFICYILYMVGQKNLRPTVVGMYNYVQPVVACCVAVFAGLEVFTVFKAVAIVLIFAGVYLVVISKSRASIESDLLNKG